MHVCLFDIDGTLISSGGAGRAALEESLAVEFGVQPQTDRLLYSGRTDRSIIRDLFQLHGLDDLPASRERLMESYLRRLPGCLARCQGRILPGIADLLGLLSERSDVAVGLLTGNIREGARVKLDHFGLYHHFAFGGFGDHHLERDDVAREALREARRRHGSSVREEKVWVIGDTPLDVRCARTIGARVVAVATGWHPIEELGAAQPDLLLEDLSDAGSFLRVLGTQS